MNQYDNWNTNKPGIMISAEIYSLDLYKKDRFLLCLFVYEVGISSASQTVSFSSQTQIGRGLKGKYLFKLANKKLLCCDIFTNNENDEQ